MNKFIAIILLLCIGAITGCASRTDMRHGQGKDSFDRESMLKMYQNDLDEVSKAAYKEGVKQGAGAARKMNGAYVWRPYKVETILVPGRVVNGVMYPSHEEEIIVRPTSIDRVYGKK